MYQPVLRACRLIPWQAALKSTYSYTSILREFWPGRHSDSHAICYKYWSGTSPNRTGPPKLVGSSHRHQPGQTSLVLPPRLDWSDYSEPCTERPEAKDTPPHEIHPIPCCSEHVIHGSCFWTSFADERNHMRWECTYMIQY